MQTLLEQMQGRFAQMSDQVRSMWGVECLYRELCAIRCTLTLLDDVRVWGVGGIRQIIGRIDEMGGRIDDLEKSIGDLMEQVHARVCSLARARSL